VARKEWEKAFSRLFSVAHENQRRKIVEKPNEKKENETFCSPPKLFDS
jgi:hypothetical protein